MRCGTSPVIVFSASLAFGETYTIVEGGGSRIYADCCQTEATDHIDIVATSTAAERPSNTTAVMMSLALDTARTLAYDARHPLPMA